MARRKNVKRIDPRYFLHERLDVDSLAQQVANEPELENQLRAMPQEFDEKTSKPQFADKLELVRSFVLQTEPFTSGDAGWIPGEAEAVAKRALQLVFDRTAKFETVNRDDDGSALQEDIPAEPDWRKSFSPAQQRQARLGTAKKAAAAKEKEERRKKAARAKQHAAATNPNDPCNQPGAQWDPDCAHLPGYEEE